MKVLSRSRLRLDVRVKMILAQKMEKRAANREAFEQGIENRLLSRTAALLLNRQLGEGDPVRGRQ